MRHDDVACCAVGGEDIPDPRRAFRARAEAADDGDEVHAGLLHPPHARVVERARKGGAANHLRVRADSPVAMGAVGEPGNAFEQEALHRKALRLQLRLRAEEYAR